MKNSILILSLILLINPFISVGQISFSTKDKKAIQYFEEAQMNYRQGQLSSALANYDEAIKKDSLFIEAHLEKGLLFGDQRKFKEASYSLEKVIAIDGDKFPEAHYYLGNFYLNLAKYDEAKTSLEKYLSYHTEDLKKNENANMMIRKCEFARKNTQSEVAFNPINLGPGVNTHYREYYPCLTADDAILLFTRQIASNKTMDGQNEDFYVSMNDGRYWTNAQNMGLPINTIFNEGAPTLSVDGNLLIFTACAFYGDYGPKRKGYGSCDLFFSQKVGSQWSQPVNLGPTINTKHKETMPSFSSDGRTLYFVRGFRDRGAIDNNAYDIFQTYLTDTGWTKPVKLPPVINTPNREESVFIHPDGKTLYFSSDGHPGFGGLDIFMSKKDAAGNWSKPLNLGYPINTENDENSLMVNAKGNIGYFASDRPGGYGMLDLYQFEMPEDKKPEAVTFMKGRVFDAITNQPLLAKFELIDLKTGEIIIESYSNGGNGEFIVCLPPNKDYALNASRDGYLFFSENFTLSKSASNNKPFLKDVPLMPIKEGATVVLNNIFFETNKYDLKPQSMVELNKLFNFLEKNSGVNVEIGGHTDNTGGKELNITLSMNRAKSVYDYLIQHKIAPERLSYKGYADNIPLATNETKQGRAKNRRTEFKIIGFQ